MCARFEIGEVIIFDVKVSTSVRYVCACAAVCVMCVLCVCHVCVTWANEPFAHGVSCVCECIFIW